MRFQFIIPLSNSDLLNSEGDNYFVKQIYDAGEIPDLLKECKRELENCFHIFDHFDTYFSIVENAKDLSAVYLLRSFDLLLNTTVKITSKLIGFFANKTLNDDDRNSFLNLTKMTLFLITETVKAIDTIRNKAQTEGVVGQGKKGKKGTTCVEGFEGHNWDEKRFKFLVQLYNISQLPLERLWNPPIPEESFVTMLCDIAYRTLELYYSKDKNVADSSFQILGTALKRYNHAMTFPTQILRVLRCTENAVIPIANGIILLHEEFGITTIFSVLLKDIIETLNADSGDNQITKNFSTFLLELAQIAPKVIMPHLAILSEELLNLESYSLRNSILQVIGDVIMRELTSEELSEDDKKIRNEFLEDLLYHVNDISAHVRSKVLQIWCHLKEQNAVPLAFQNRVLLASVERLEDKGSLVRKNAIILIKSFLERNPYAPNLTLDELIRKHKEESENLQKLRDDIASKVQAAAEMEKKWEEIVPEVVPIIVPRLPKDNCPEQTPAEAGSEDFSDIVDKVAIPFQEKNYTDAISLIMKADQASGNAELRKTLNKDELTLYYVALVRSYYLLANGCKEPIDELFNTQMQTVKFLEDSIEFTKLVAAAVPKINEMLMSKVNTDVFEAVDFFTTGHMFGIRGTEDGMRHVLNLVWSADKEKRDCVFNAYKKIFFTTDMEDKRVHYTKVIQNLMAFLENCSFGDFAAMEVLIKEWVENNEIDNQMIQILFEIFTMKHPNLTEFQSKLAIQFLIMASAAKSSIASANINVIVNIGFGERGLSDPIIFCCCIDFLLNSIDVNSKTKYYKRYSQNHEYVTKVSDIYMKFFFHPRIEDFDNATMKTLEFFYQLCQTPDIICQNLLRNIHSKMKKFAKQCEELRMSQFLSQHAAQEASELAESSEKRRKMAFPTFLISRFIFLLGFATMKEMIFLDIDVYNNMRYRQDLTEERKNLKKKQKRKTLTINISASESLKRLSGSAAEPQQEPDEELVGATAEDTIAELINYICEEELLYSDNGILAKFIPLIIKICKYPGKYRDETLQQTACLSLIRFMSVSSKFCEEQMSFLMNILNLQKNIKIKCNIVIGLSDLTFRFPNILEPWTSHFYSILHEHDDELRLTAVKMLSHLILHEMIRVKGQIADLAMCIVDGNEEIKNITKQFFKEIANKANILYNVLPDIISKLSDTKLGLTEENYRTIMRYILSLIHKDKQVESLIEKLCLRFRVTHEERQWRDIAFCLSLLSYNERTIKKLIEHVQYFKDKVQIDDVYQCFKTIISNTSKLAKPEVKAAITEFEAALAECFEIRENNGKENAATTESGTNVMNTTQTRRKLNKRTKQKKKKESSESEDCDEDFDDMDDNQKDVPTKIPPRRRNRSRH